jgi:hypothetical protein
MVTLYGTVMSTWNDGTWITHRVETTSPDGNRLTIEVASKKRHRGSVAVRWDPRRMTEPRFVPNTDWMVYGIGAMVALAIAVVIWSVVT